MKKPKLRQVNLKQALADMLNGKAGCFITMDPGQWDGHLAAAYRTGWTLLEIVNEVPVKAYKAQTA